MRDYDEPTYCAAASDDREPIAVDWPESRDRYGDETPTQLEYPLGDVSSNNGTIRVWSHRLIFDRDRPWGTNRTIRERIYLYDEGIYLIVSSWGGEIFESELALINVVKATIGEAEAAKVLQADQDLSNSDWWDEANRTLSWCNRKYLFTRTQAPIVALLWEAHETGLPDVTDEKLIEASGTDRDKEACRLRDIFKGSGHVMHPAWGSVIVESNMRRGARRLKRSWE